MKLYIRRFIYIFLGNLDRLLGRKSLISIYCYHSISQDPWFYSVTLASFEKQVRYLSDEYSALSLADLTAYFYDNKSITVSSFAIMFDDGYEDILSSKSILQQLNIKPTLFVVSYPDKVSVSAIGTRRPFLSDQQIATLESSGWDIGCHSNSHINLTELASPQGEIPTSTVRKSFAYPWGKHTPQVVAAVKAAGYKLGFSMDDAQITKSTNYLTIPRIGVSQTHSFREFKYLNSPSVIIFRHLAKSLHLTI